MNTYWIYTAAIAMRHYYVADVGLRMADLDSMRHAADVNMQPYARDFMVSVRVFFFRHIRRNW